MFNSVSYSHKRAQLHTCTHHFRDHFPHQSVFASFPIDSQSTVILVLGIFTPIPLTAISRGFEAEVFAGGMSFQSPNQPCQSAEGSELHKERG